MSFFRYSYSQYSAKFLTGLRRFLLLNRFKNGLVIDGKARISEKNSLQGTLVLGSTGYGKSTAFVVPNVMTIKNASMVIIDPSQELYNLTHSYLAKHFDVKCLNLIQPEKSHRWQALYTAKTKEDVTMIADAIISASFKNDNGNNRFWNQSAKNLIAILLTSVLHRPEQKNLSYIYAMLNRYNDTDKTKLNKELSKQLDRETWLEYKAMMSQPEKLIGNVIATCRTALAPIITQTLKTVSSGNDIDIASLRTKPTVLFICIAENRFHEFGLFVSLLLREITETLSIMPKKSDMTVYMLLDEAGNFYCHKLSSFITVCRKRRVSVSLILQSMRQLRALYKDDADTIIENTKNHIYFPGLSLEASKMISQKIGNIYEDFNQTYLPTNAKRGRKYPLISPEAIRTLKNGRALFLSGNMPVVKLKLTPWHQNFWMRLKLRD